MDLTEAIILAAQAHDGVPDKSGVPYIEHPLRVMLSVPEQAKVVAVLHDVIEDTPYGFDALARRGLGDPELTALKLVSRDDGEKLCSFCSGNSPDCEHCDGEGVRPTYAQFISRIARAEGEAGRLARVVKIADIEDNMRPDRDWADQAGMIKSRYEPALKVLRKAMLDDLTQMSQEFLPGGYS